MNIKLNTALVYIGTILAAFGTIPVAFGAAKIPLPNWFYAICVIFGVLGPVLIGLGAKSKDMHSTQDQIQQATMNTQTSTKPTTVQGSASTNK